MKNLVSIFNVCNFRPPDSRPDPGGVGERHPLLARLHAAADIAVLDDAGRREAALVGLGPPSPRVSLGRR